VDAQELWELECQTVRECGAVRIPPWMTRWPWEQRTARNVGAPKRKRHRGVVATPALVQHPARLLAIYGLQHLYGGHIEGLGLSLVLEHIGLTRRQREAYEMYAGLRIPQTEIAAALGISQAAVSFRLENARSCIEAWRATIPHVRSRPYRSATSREAA
jgi:hypothetical protein